VGRLISEAYEVARDGLAVGLPRRWRRVQAVADKAAAAAEALAIDDEILVAGAWLHDIGYASDIAETGFHEALFDAA
jgi:hypothetical protein